MLYLKATTRKLWSPVGRSHLQWGHLYPIQRANRSILACRPTTTGYPRASYKDIRGQMILLLGGCRTQWRVLSSIPDLQPLDASRCFPNPCGESKTRRSLQTWPMSAGGQGGGVGWGGGNISRLRTTGLNQYDVGHCRQTGLCSLHVYLKISKLLNDTNKLVQRTKEWKNYIYLKSMFGEPWKT